MQKIYKIALKLGFAFSLAFAFSGCISPKTDAFLLGAGIGVGATTYFLNGGSIAGYSLESFRNGSRNPTQRRLQDYSIPSELEWHYLEQEFYSQTGVRQR